MKGKLDESTYWLPMGLECLDQTISSAYITSTSGELAYLMLNELQVSKLIDQ
jgi:hypothetical protein